MSLFVTFEGLEGCGKTTQIRRLAGWLEEAGYAVLATREPGGTRIGDAVREILLHPNHTEMVPAAEVLLFSAARAQIVNQVIRPHLEQGGVVLCDRFADSTLAYQGYGLGLDRDVLRTITQFAIGATRPNVTIYLDVPIEEGLRRKAGCDLVEWNRMERRDFSYHQRVYAGYQELIAAEPARWAVVDATQDIESVASQLRSEVARRLSFSEPART